MKRKFTRLAMMTLVLSFAPILLSAQPIFTDATRSARERAEDIVKHMTLDEKVALMIYNSPSVERLGIRNYNWWNEALHGIARNGNATVFPMPIAMAASFDTELLEQVFTSISDEGRIKWVQARAANDSDMWYKGLSYWTPNINIFRDPRWGRGMETYGEDPYLTSQLGMAVVRGLQGERGDGTIKAMACAKHYALHSGPEWARHSFDAVASERDVWETYLPAFKDLVMKAKVDQVMFAYNRMFGYPAGANERFMRDILEKEWGFKGIVVSDCWAVKDFYDGHKWAKNNADAAAAAVKAGMDMECGSAMPAIPKAIKQGLITEAELNDGIIKVMEYRYLLGEMDGESEWDNISPDKLCSAEHAALARKIADESIVLLENDGILPLKKSEKVLLMGPNADEAAMFWGNYNGFPLHPESLLGALKRKGVNVEYLPGVPYVAGLTTSQIENSDVSMKATYNPDNADFDYDSIVRATADYETIIFAGGIAPCLEGEELHVNAPGFKGGDRVTIELPEVQKKLMKALKEAGKRVVLVNFSGSAMAFADESENCEAILQAWYLGQAGGEAVADVLYGDVNPSGKLPLTFYANDSQLADYECYDMKGRTYRYFDGKPQFAFGHGLSYTTFKFGKGKVVKGTDGAEFVVKVKNTGKRDGDNVVQLYVSRPDDAEGPIKTLRGYKRVSLKAGEAAEVRIPVDEETFLWWNPESGRMNPMAGEYVLHYGDTSDDAGLKQIKYVYSK
ncbi:MAG: glycoside hydrolase family 3 C-terminal domain-containing protein [Alistipes sp.]|nr:glycoside hydrolase family 3 C-terminal domain-containing protein [Alistipes sp.]